MYIYNLFYLKKDARWFDKLSSTAIIFYIIISKVEKMVFIVQMCN